ncbi:MAG: hypothetical protein HOQ45_00710, partial [Nocardioidaceae bacterium]|nr:hypothetical protein [Nocardioidaceae bacterium]
ALRGPWRSWAPARRLGAGAAVLLLGWALVGGLGAYATATFSATVGQLLVLLLVLPLLLAQTIPPDLLRLPAAAAPLARPVNAALLVVAFLTLVMQTPLLGLSLRSTAGHLLLTLAAVVVGLLTVPALQSRDGASAAGLLLAAVLLVQGWHLRSTGLPVADGFFEELDWWWGDAPGDQRLAGAVLLAGAVVPLLALVPRRDFTRSA